MLSWHSVPFVRVLIPYTAGILTCYYFNPATGLIFSFFCLTFLVAFFFRKILTKTAHFRLRFVQGVFISLVFLGLGSVRTCLYNDMEQPGHFSGFKHAAVYHIKIDDAVVEKKKFYRCYATVKAVSDSDGNAHSARGFMLVYFNKRHVKTKPEVGDLFFVRANPALINEPANPGEFNYREYLALRNIRHQLFSDSVFTHKSTSVEQSIYSRALHFRDHCLGIITRHIPSVKEKGVAEALLLGYKDDLDPDITQAFSRTGTLHVLAVSGMHAGLIFLLIGFFTRSLERKKHGRWIQLALVLTGIWFYAFMTGLSSSVLRASVMFSIISFGKTLDYKANIYNTLYASAFILLVYNPLYIFDVGFQLSYLAVLGIVWLQPMIGRLYSPPNKQIKYIWDLLTVSLAAQVLTFPITLFYFHQFPNYFLLSNMLIIPLTSFILLGLIALLAMSWIPFASACIAKILLHMITFNNWLVTGIDSLPYALSNGFYINFAQVVLLYLSIICCIALFSHRKKWIFFLMSGCICLFAVTAAYRRYTQDRQKIFVIHSVKGYDVFSCLDGKTAYVISDSNFFTDPSSYRFHVEPYLLSRGISDIKKLGLEKNFVSTNIRLINGVGFQFFDNIMTIENPVLKIIQRNHFILLKKFDNDKLKLKEKFNNQFIISNSLSNKELKKMRKEYFKLFHKSLKLNEKATVFFLQ